MVQGSRRLWARGSVRGPVAYARGSVILGWVVSGAVHALLAGVLIWGSSGGEAAGPAVGVSRGELVESRSIEPVVRDLKVEEGFAEPAAEIAGLGVSWLEKTEGWKPSARGEKTEGKMPSARGESEGGVAWARVPGAGLALGGEGVEGAAGFCGTGGGEAGRVAYVVDCSGSMVMAWDYVRGELFGAIEGLGPGEYFQVVFYSAGAPREFSAGRLTRASAGQRLRARRFVEGAELGQVSQARDGAAAVEAALGRALGARTAEGEGPELIYLLTDGKCDPAGAQALVRRVRGGGGGCRVNVIACGSREYEEGLRRLAALTGGMYRFLTDEEVIK